MTIVFEMMGGNVPEDRIQNLIKNLVVQETGAFADKKVVVRMYGKKRRTVRGCEYLNSVQLRWAARKQRRKLQQEIQKFAAATFNKRM